MSYCGQMLRRRLFVEGLTLHLFPHKCKNHSHTLIWLHGLGDTAYGFVEVFDTISQDPCPACFKVVLPTAPMRPVTINWGQRMPSWYDILDLQSGKCNINQVEESSEAIVKLIDQEVEELRSKNKENGYQNILLGGFSQGAALSLYTGLVKTKEKLAGIICLSGYALETFESQQIKHPSTPVFIYHGQQDLTLMCKSATESYHKYLKNINYNLTVEDGLQHQVSDKELQCVRDWIKGNLCKTVKK